MDVYLETDAKNNFKKGMTLSEYMQQMKPEDSQFTQGQMPQSTQDLYQTCFINQKINPSAKLIPFNIPQIDEDNDESSVDFTPINPFYHSINHQNTNQKQLQNCHLMSAKKVQKQSTTMQNAKKQQRSESGFQKQSKKEYRIKHQSNSPFKKENQITPTKTNLSKTLYGNGFISNNLLNMSTASSTLYRNKLLKINEKSVPRTPKQQSKLKLIVGSQANRNTSSTKINATLTTQSNMKTTSVSNTTAKQISLTLKSKASRIKFISERTKYLIDKIDQNTFRLQNQTTIILNNELLSCLLFSSSLFFHQFSLLLSQVISLLKFIEENLVIWL